MSRKKDELSSEHICVRQRAMCCSNLWEHLCLRHEGAFITFLLKSVAAEEFQCDARAIHHAGRPSVARRGAFNTSASRFQTPNSVGIETHQHCPRQCSRMSTKFWLENQEGKKKALQLQNEGVLLAQLVKPRKQQQAQVNPYMTVGTSSQHRTIKAAANYVNINPKGSTKPLFKC